MLGKRMSLNGPTKIKSIVNPDRHEKRKRARALCELVRDQVRWTESEEDLPRLELKSHMYARHYEGLGDERLLWTLFESLLDEDLGGWLRRLVAPGLEHSLEETRRQYGSLDPFATTFTLLVYGERERASDTARECGDPMLAMYIVHSDLKDLSTTLTRQLIRLQEDGQWKSEYHKKCWSLIAGQSGETENVTWQCALAMYIWYGTGLAGYHQACTPNPASVQSIQIAQHTPRPDRECLWYQLLMRYYTDQEVYVDHWPLDFLWLLSLYRPQLMPGDTYLLRWCDELESLDMPEWALFSALFLQNKKAEKVKHLLRHAEWEDDPHVWASQFRIPEAWICIAKSLRAHDDWDFEGEYESLLEGHLSKEAWMALLNFLLPKHFYCTLSALRTSLTYIMEYTEPERYDVQLLKRAYMYLISKEGDTHSGLIRELEEYSNLLKAYPNAHGLIVSLIEAIKE
ncbi:hypothetical protein BY458DRAFT_522886 [Sporodiniella umbellata]|nr:hypothetical protein BY458DRAFT_522886 [Sporodiniella umbellata]